MSWIDEVGGWAVDQIDKELDARRQQVYSTPLPATTTGANGVALPDGQRQQRVDMEAGTTQTMLKNPLVIAAGVGVVGLLVYLAVK